MKRIFTLSAILVATGMLMPSCGTHLTIAKRQHSRGYHVDISSDKKSTHKQTESIDVRDVEENGLATENPKKGNTAIGSRHVVKAVEETAKVEALTVNEAAAPEKAVAEKTTVAEKNNSAPAAESGIESDKSSTNVVKSTVKNSVEKFTESKQMKKMESQRADGLSLFWIVILILLILYFLGLLGGLGWFIHLALVVALILLILWLLGIV